MEEMKKRKRALNHEYARKSQMRKQKQPEDLTKEVNKLQSANKNFVHLFYHRKTTNFAFFFSLSRSSHFAVKPFHLAKPLDHLFLELLDRLLVDLPSMLHEDATAKAIERSHSFGHPQGTAKASLTPFPGTGAIDAYHVNQLHAHMIITGFIRSPSLTTSLILSFISSPHEPLIDFARSVFFKHHAFRNPSIWNTVIRSHSHGFHPKRAPLVLRSMLENAVCLDEYSFSLALKACAKVGLVREGMLFHGLLWKMDFGEDIFLHNCLIVLFIRCSGGRKGGSGDDIGHQRWRVAWEEEIPIPDSLGRARLSSSFSLTHSRAYLLRSSPTTDAPPLFRPPQIHRESRLHGSTLSHASILLASANPPRVAPPWLQPKSRLHPESLLHPPGLHKSTASRASMAPPKVAPPPSHASTLSLSSTLLASANPPRVEPPWLHPKSRLHLPSLPKL
ncbi:hypothetical protein Fmac_006759 [Flemingia macrophylla]|uniref:BZIP domain-containing protein n=1 Tax=Flemingia macrophylla TaxID=520843 RepID=A0ABD1NBI1_9FABA